MNFEPGIRLDVFELSRAWAPTAAPSRGLAVGRIDAADTWNHVLQQNDIHSCVALMSLPRESDLAAAVIRTQAAPLSLPTENQDDGT